MVVLAKLISDGPNTAPIAQLAADLRQSASQVHLSLKRLERSRLIADAAKHRRPLLRAVEEFLIHGVKYAFPAQRGEPTRGVPTAHAAPPLSQHFSAGSELPPVWPSPDGQVRGTTLEPLHRVVPAVVMKDPALYEILALLDALRDGRARERRLAERELSLRLRKRLRG
ncbi:MAG TPA: hypothetical protein VGQ52_00035 [Gemmatimonadaceae bacterium]|nr:hypothetical protein [Gemmatimonadaceae bacterium]